MRLNFILNVESVVEASAPPVSIFPPPDPIPGGSEVVFAGKYPPPGVGVAFTGKYVTPPGSKIVGHLEYAHTTTSIGTLITYPGVVGIGQMSLHATTPCKQQLIIFYSYEILIGDPTVSFTVRAVEGQVTAATIDGHPVKVVPKIEILEGGRSYAVSLKVSVY